MLKRNNAFTRKNFRQALLSFTAGLTTLGFGSAALAQAEEGVVVTGSRIVRNGYSAPTPLNVVGIEELQTSAGSNITDVLRSVPAFAGNTTPSSGTSAVSSGGSGINLLNLRSMGPNRTLILIDGQRSVASRPDSVVDVNTIPQQLVQRVDVVTGGASAVYGSDAVTGVVNFVLDRNSPASKPRCRGE